MVTTTSDAAARSLARRHSVLIVDQSPENREVLRTMLERRGLEILEADLASEGLRLARSHHPEVVVLDADAADERTAESPAEVGDAFDALARSDDARLVVLGRLPGRRGLRADSQSVAKPYHFGALIDMIESLVARTPANA